MVEEWRAIPGYEGLYEASNTGHIRNIASGMGRTPGKILKSTPTGRYGHRTVALRKSGKTYHWFLHRLVALTFNGHPSEEKPYALHKDGNVDNNRPENLYWGSKKDNALDSVRHGTRRNQHSNKTHCIRGHEFTDENTYVSPISRRRACITCRTTPPPEGHPSHGKASTYGNRGCRCTDCTEAWRIKSLGQYQKRKERRERMG